MKILIADDDRDQQHLVAAYMNMWGYEFDIAPNGKRAVELATTNEGKYDLCLMDIDMPVMNGFEATRTIRQNLKYLPIMALSGNPSADTNYLDAGMDAFLAKPYDPPQLYDKINQLDVKAVKIEYDQNKLVLIKEMPMNPDELRELVELKKKGLTKLKIVGLESSFVVHKNIQNKISYDLIGEGKELTEFIDRSDKEPGRCHLYRMNLHVTKDLFIPAELEEAIQREDQLAIKFDKVTDKKLPE